MALTREALHSHRAAHAADPAARLFFFHAHIYGAESNEGKLQRQQLAQTIRARWPDDARLEVHKVIDKPVGPHPLPQFEVLFTRDLFPDVVTWLQYNLPEDMSVMFHNLSKDQHLDHTQRALWLGKQLEVKDAMLHEMDKKFAGEGLDEEEIIWRVCRVAERVQV